MCIFSELGERVALDRGSAIQAEFDPGTKSIAFSSMLNDRSERLYDFVESRAFVQ